MTKPSEPVKRYSLNELAKVIGVTPEHFHAFAHNSSLMCEEQEKDPDAGMWFEIGSWKSKSTLTRYFQKNVKASWDEFKPEFDVYNLEELSERARDWSDDEDEENDD